MNPFKQDAADSIGKWMPVIETEEGLELYIYGAKVDRSQEDLDLIYTLAIKLEVESSKNNYKTLRAKDYAKLNQFELMYDDKVNGTASWLDAVAAIKNKHPKPT